MLRSYPKFPRRLMNHLFITQLSCKYKSNQLQISDQIMTKNHYHKTGNPTGENWQLQGLNRVFVCSYRSLLFYNQSPWLLTYKLSMWDLWLSFYNLLNLVKLLLFFISLYQTVLFRNPIMEYKFKTSAV